MSTVLTPGTAIAPPLWVLAELTYTCPLHCAYCSNPVDLARQSPELTTEDWLRVLREARELGGVQLGFSGGEPLTRPDLELLVAEGRRLGFYTNLITSGIGLDGVRLRALKDAGLDHLQLSFQDSTRAGNDFLSGTRTFDRKRRLADQIKAHGFPMVMNCVIHRLNIDHIDDIIDLAVDIGAEYLELANAQYYGWAHLNRELLIPTRDQVERAEATVTRRRSTLGNRLRLLFVVPDYFERRPKRCMNGWGSTFICISPDGTALPCPAARMLPGHPFPSVREASLRDIWTDAPLFNAFRGERWMPEPCRSCPERATDLGGCRCQAYLLTGDSGATDPVCDKSPQHGIVEAAIAARNTVVDRPLIFRSPTNARSIVATAGTDGR